MQSNKKIFLVLTGVVMLVSCLNRQQQTMPMQGAVDSLTMWYGQMNADSMEAASQRIHSFLAQHDNDQIEPIRRLRAHWLKARGVWFSAIKGQPDSAIIYTERALREIEGNGNDIPPLQGMDKIKVVAMANRADFYRQVGRMDMSVDGYLQALHVVDSLQMDNDMRIVVMLGIGTACSCMGDYVGSRDWWRRMEELLPEMSANDRFIYYNNVGNDDYFQDHYQEAHDNFIKAAQLVKDDSTRTWDYAAALGNLAEIYVCLGRVDSAHIALGKADSLLQKISFQPYEYYLTTTRLKLLMLENRMVDALRLARQQDHDDMPIPAGRVLRLKALEQLMQHTGHWKDAYYFHRQWHVLNDSIQSANIQMQKSARFMQYEHDRRLLEQQREIDHERMTSRLTMAILVVALLVVIVLVVLLILRNRRNRFQELRTRQQIVGLRMENTRQRITPHFIYNALNHEMLEQIKGRPVDFSPLIQLLRSGTEQADNLRTTLAEELRFVDYYVKIEGRQMAGQFQYTKNITPDVNCERVSLPAMSVQIFVENAIKHGLRRQGGILTINVLRQGTKTLIEVIDNGEGFAPSYQEHTGMRVVRQTIQILNEHNREQISFGAGNLQQGARSWLLLPDDYNYELS